MENETVKQRWKNIKQPKVLMATITSDGNAHCQTTWLGRILFIGSYYDMVIFENSDTVDNYKRLL